MKATSQLKRKTPLTARKLAFPAKTSLKATTQLKATAGPKKRKSKRIDVKAANLARAIWRLHGSCEHCGRSKPEVQLQGAHLIGTGASPRLASDLRNGMALCSHCHRTFTSDPVAFYEFLQGTWAVQYLPALRRLQKSSQRVDWHGRIEFLKDIELAIVAGEISLADARAYEADY